MSCAAEAERRDAGEPAIERGPLRRCLATGERQPQHCLLRFVRGPDGALVPDLAGRLPGRGMWLTPSRVLFERAVRRRLFSRAAQAPVSVPAGLADELAEQLRRSCLDLLGLAKRAGLAVAGHEKVRERLRMGRVALLLQARDGSEESRRRLTSLGRGVNPSLAEIEIFSASELGIALGRPAAVHVAVAAGGLAVRLGREAERLSRYETEAPAGAGK